MRVLKGIILVSSLVSLGACATVTRGTSTAWTVETDPAGAKVVTSAGFACEATPCTFKMQRKTEFDVTITKEGYKPWKGRVLSQISGAGGAGMAGNLVLGGIIGAGIDASSGAMKDLKPNPLVVHLEPIGKEEISPDANIN